MEALLWTCTDADTRHELLFAGGAITTVLLGFNLHHNLIEIPGGHVSFSETNEGFVFNELRNFDLPEINGQGALITGGGTCGGESYLLSRSVLR